MLCCTRLQVYTVRCEDDLRELAAYKDVKPSNFLQLVGLQRNSSEGLPGEKAERRMASAESRRSSLVDSKTGLHSLRRLACIRSGPGSIMRQERQGVGGVISRAAWGRYTYIRANKQIFTSADTHLKI